MSEPARSRAIRRCSGPATHRVADLGQRRREDHEDCARGHDHWGSAPATSRRGRSGLTRMAKLTFERPQRQRPGVLWPEEYAKVREAEVKNDVIALPSVVKGSIVRMARHGAEFVITKVIPVRAGPRGSCERCGDQPFEGVSRRRSSRPASPDRIRPLEDIDSLIEASASGRQRGHYRDGHNSSRSVTPTSSSPALREPSARANARLPASAAERAASRPPPPPAAPGEPESPTQLDEI